ncbi:MAG: zinc ribbon-containing protein, partial [Colwellia sp.]|nr:zinc ribbon-containing protein [Colwellia sp.]
MALQNDYFADIYQKLNDWLAEVKTEQKPHLDEFIKQAKLYAGAAETMTEEKLKQFSDNLKYDLHDFYQLNRSQAKHSLYLGLLNETLWENLAKLTVQSLVEWAERVDDFDHDGQYK